MIVCGEIRRLRHIIRLDLLHAHAVRTGDDHRRLIALRFDSTPDSNTVSQ